LFACLSVRKYIIGLLFYLSTYIIILCINVFRIFFLIRVYFFSNYYHIGYQNNSFRKVFLYCVVITTFVQYCVTVPLQHHNIHILLSRYHCAFHLLFSIRRPLLSTRDIEPPSRSRLYCWAMASPSLWITGSRPAERHRIHQAREPTAVAAEGCVWDDLRERVVSNMWACEEEEENVEDTERKRFKKGHREKGISGCVALKLINRDETTSVIKTGNVGAYVTSYFIQSHVCVCVERVRLSEYGVHPPSRCYKRPTVAYGPRNLVIFFRPGFAFMYILSDSNASLENFLFIFCLSVADHGPKKCPLIRWASL